MEDLYTDLENYHYENTVSELKNENQELKSKLEEYASTLANLQKDFDKLSEEYKKLELNYSSLLKTARAEIERKSQLITNLNIEKDKLVIESIQSTGRKPQRNYNTIAYKWQTAKHLSKVEDSAKSENNAAVLHLPDNNVSETPSNNRKDEHEKAMPTLGSNLKDNLDMKEREQKLEKCDTENNENKKNRESNSNAFIKAAVNNTLNKQSKSSLVSSVKDDPEVKDKEQKSKKFDNCIERDKKKDEFKSIKQTDSGASNNNVLANKVSKISNRRKSMPLLNRGDFKFSSDEEQNDDLKDHRFRRKIPIREDRTEIGKHYDKHREHHGKYEPERKMSELTRTGDRQVVHYDASRDVNRKSSNWNRESDRYKNKDSRERYDSKDKRDRYENKDHRDRFEGKDNRDRFDSKDNRDRFGGKDNRDRYESNQRSRRYLSPDRQCNTQAECYNKQRDSSDRSHRFDNIRHRTLISPPPETYRQHRSSREFDGQGFHKDRHYPSKHNIHDVIEEPACKRFRSESLNKASEQQMTMYDRDIQSRASSMSRPLELSYLSLQSPDYVYLENHPPVHQIKEIKSTSESKLDDPRLTSNKYIANNHKSKVILSTIVGRDVELKPINTTVWNTNKDKHRYEMPMALIEKPPITENFIKDIYMDIENPVSNLSLESGEICLDEEMDVVSENQGTGNIEGNDFKNVCNNVQGHYQNEINRIESVDKIDNGLQACPSVLPKNYKIPKLKKSNPSKLFEEDDTYSKRDKGHKKDNIKHSHKERSHKEKKDLKKKLQTEANEYTSSGPTEVRKNKKHKVHDKNHRKISPEKPKILPKDTVEGDLELSDDTCDYVDISDHTKYDEGNEVQKLEECNKDSALNTIEDGMNKGHKSNCNKKEHTVFKLGIETSNENKHFNLLDKGQEAKSKESLIKSNKEQQSKGIKNKLNDLFGDTSSLITLDDLGVVAPAAAKETLNDYAPSFDNTQDAVDLNIAEMEEVQTRCMKSKRDEDSLLPDGTREGKEGKKEHKEKKHTTKERRNSNNTTDKGSSIQHVFKNVNTEPRDNSVVKTVIISTGVQNQCHSVSDAHDEGAKQLPSVQGKAKDNVTSCPAMLSIKALATSTPCKSQNELTLPVPDTSRNSNNSTLTNDNNSSKTENSSKVTQSNLDIPDVRIIVKRRRKTKGAP